MKSYKRFILVFAVAFVGIGLFTANASAQQCISAMGAECNWDGWSKDPNGLCRASWGVDRDCSGRTTETSCENNNDCYWIPGCTDGRDSQICNSASVKVNTLFYYCQNNALTKFKYYTCCVPFEYPDPGGSTPYLFAYLDGRYVVDNEVLNTVYGSSFEGAKKDYEAIAAGGAEPTGISADGRYRLQATDYYKMRVNPSAGQDGVRLQIKEIEPEESHLDEVRLLRVLYTQDSQLIVEQEQNKVLAVKQTATNSLVSCEYNGGDCLGTIGDVDADYIDGKTGDEMVLKINTADFKDKETYLVFNSWGNAPLKPLAPPYEAAASCSLTTMLFDLDNTGNFVRLKDVHPRELESEVYVDITDVLTQVKGEILGLKLQWTDDHKVDYIGTMTAEEVPYRQEELALKTAVHSKDGDVTEALSQKDFEYAHTVTGDAIELVFQAPGLALKENEKESYIFVSSGFYHGLRTSLYPQVDTSDAWKEELDGYVGELKKVLKENNIPSSLNIE